MKAVVAAVFVLAAIFVYDACGRPEGAFSVNVHFVPAIHRGNCTAGRPWKPQNIRCAQCLCIVNRFSRCVPEPGCKPSETTNGTTTAAAGGSSTTVLPGSSVTPVPGAAVTPAPNPPPGDNPAANSSPAPAEVVTEAAPGGFR